LEPLLSFDVISSSGFTIMRFIAIILFLLLLAILPFAPRTPQKAEVSASPNATAAPGAPASPLAGRWTYRSYRNDPALVGDDANKALALIFAEAVFKFEIPTSTTIKGTIDWPGGGLDLKGSIQGIGEGGASVVEIVGTGRPNTSTAGWEYDYHGQLAYHWPNGVNQVPALIGTVIRAKAHTGGAAGYVASFVAVKQP
jgi:hypothetical protein